MEAVRGSRAVRRQLLVTDGVVGFSMLAEPMRKHDATLSVWRDEAALDAFAKAHPHDRLVAELSPAMGQTKFVRWTISGADGRPSWDDALVRMKEVLVTTADVRPPSPPWRSSASRRFRADLIASPRSLGVRAS